MGVHEISVSGIPGLKIETWGTLRVFSTHWVRGKSSPCEFVVPLRNVTTESIDPQLRRNSLGLPELIFQSVTHIAPATNMVFTYPIIALKAGPDMPLSFLLATTICFFIGNTVVQFSRYMPSSGRH